jgi:UDP-N-acetylglucosamine 2-epimerase (non-hydrolysing)
MGTRPEAIKLAAVIHALRADPAMDVRVCSTGQHREMLDQILPVFDIEPDEDLALMRPDQSLAALTAAAVAGLDDVLARHRPSLVLVQGDTTTAFAAALAAFYRKVPVGHVEAGLRTGDMQSPWPEEANRVLITRLTNLHFAPTNDARWNLIQEGVPADRVLVTGNTVVDALLFALKKLPASIRETPGLPASAFPAHPAQRLVLVTGHRRESFGPAFENMCRAIGTLASQFPDVSFVYPVHLNPRVREAVHNALGSACHPNIQLLGPLPYLPFVALLQRACLILSDSGGVQEEAPTLGVPVLVLRSKTERPEAVACGAALLVGTDPVEIVSAARRLLTDDRARLRMAAIANPFGDGLAGRRIAGASSRFLLGLGVSGEMEEFSPDQVSSPNA